MGKKKATKGRRKAGNRGKNPRWRGCEKVLSSRSIEEIEAEFEFCLREAGAEKGGVAILKKGAKPTTGSKD